MDDYLSCLTDTSFWFGFGFAGLALAVYVLVIMPLFRFVWGFCFNLLRQLPKQPHSHQGSVTEPLSGVARDQSNSAETSAESNACLEATLPKLGHSDYYTEPQIQELADRERAEPGYCSHVKDFVVGRRGYGCIKFLGETDVRGLDLDSIIEINEQDVIVYMDDSGKSPFDLGPWKPKVVTNLYLKCIHKKTGNQIFEGPRWEQYVLALKSPVPYWGLEGLRQFTYQSLVDATQDFSLDCRVSVDCLGDVFRGKLFSTNEDIVIRRIEPNPVVISLKDFLDEVMLLSQANHPNLTKLIGYCAEKYHRFLVYEHVARGTLENQLYDLYTFDTCFDWGMRMKIALGVAKALEYLQNSMTPPILHCYIAPSNVWLDEEYLPKLSAFGVIRMCPSPLAQFGSYDYAWPDYMLAKKVTIKADIFGFGIFLLEIITGRRGIFKEDGVGHDLSNWARPYLKDEENMGEIVDRRLQGVFDYEMLQEVCDIIAKCLEMQPSRRPRIADIVAQLSYFVT